MSAEKQDVSINDREDDAEKLQRMRRGKFTEEELQNFERPKNMFDVTKMTYEEYVDKHYEIMGRKHNEQLLQQQMAMMQQMMSQQGAFAPGGMMAGAGGAGYGGQGVGGMGYGGFGMGGNIGGPMPPRPPPGYCNAFQEGLASLGTIADTSMRYGIRARLQRYLSKSWTSTCCDPNKPPGYCNAFQKGSASLVINVDRHEINPRPYNPDFAKQRQNNFGMVNPNIGASGGATGAFAAAGYGGF